MRDHHPVRNCLGLPLATETERLLANQKYAVKLIARSITWISNECNTLCGVYTGLSITCTLSHK